MTETIPARAKAAALALSLLLGLVGGAAAQTPVHTAIQPQTLHIPAAPPAAAAPAPAPPQTAPPTPQVTATQGTTPAPLDTNASTGGVIAAPPTLTPPDQAQLDTVVQSVGALQTEATKAKGDDALARVRQDAAAAQASAEAIARTRGADLAALNLKLKQLSTASGAARAHLSAAQTRERNELLGRRAKLVGQVRTARQAGATASATYTQIAAKRRDAFDSRIFERTASPLEVSFWTSLVNSMQPDARRLGRLLDDGWDGATQAPEPKGLIGAGLALAISLGLAFPVRRRLKQASRKRTAAAVSAGGLRLSAHAVGAVLIDTLLPGAAAVVLKLGLSWGDLLSDKVEAIANALVIAVFWAAVVLALSRQLAGARRADERLLPVSERLAGHMRSLAWLVALTTGAGFLINRINTVVGASVAATIAANCVVSLAYAAVASLILAAMGGEREGGGDGEEAAVRAPVRTLLSLVLSLAILVTVGAVFAGFTTFAALISSQIFWISVLVAVTYLLLRFADDMVAALFAAHGWIGRLLGSVLLLRPTLVAQLAVLTSAALQILIVLGALSLALTPIGRNGDLLSTHLLHVGQSVHLGSLVISPRSVGIGIASLVVGLGFVHLLERWMDRRFLPATDWDIGVRTSVSTGVRYLGVGAVIIWALAAAGLGFKQIALVASALSVGIGFGLQQIVQNFVSGLILLVERPVKVGDWISLGGVEGDVQRIRVRATEIRTFDKTTLIVPNSDLITKQVQNKTLGDPHGRVRLELSVGAAADAPRADDVIRKVLSTDADVLDDPPPGVFIESLTTGGSVNFVCFAYVASPRDGMRVRSRLYGEIIKAFAEEKIGFVGGPTEVVLQPGAELRSLVDGLAASRPPPAPDPSANAGQDKETRRAERG